MPESGQPSEHGATERRRWTIKACADCGNHRTAFALCQHQKEAISRSPEWDRAFERVEVVEAGTPGDREALARVREWAIGQRDTWRDTEQERRRRARLPGGPTETYATAYATAMDDVLAALSAPVTIEPGDQSIGNADLVSEEAVEAGARALLSHMEWVPEASDAQNRGLREEAARAVLSAVRDAGEGA